MSDFDVSPHDAFHRWVRLPLAKALCWVLFTLFGPTLVFGRRKVPKKGGVLILANHQADVDPILVQIACRRPIHFMAKSELFEMGLLGKVIRKFRAFPVKRGEPDRTSLKHAINLLHAGEVVSVFPEGELSPTGEILELKKGVSLMIRSGGVPVICVGLHNTRRMMPYGKLMPRPAFALITARWGEPKTFDRSSDADEIMAWVEAELIRLSGYPKAPSQSS